MNKRFTLKLYVVSVIGVLSLGTNTNASAEQYLTLSYGYADLDDSANSGVFPNGFTTGAGTNVPAGTALPADTTVAWTTEFESGDSFAIGYGLRFGGSFRAEINYSSQDNDVDTHSGVTVATDLNIDGEDAGVLITGSGNLGASVGAIVADARGNVETDYLMLLGYYDFSPDSKFTPFIGAGIGYADTDITFNPSGVGIVDDSDSSLAYQVSAGATLSLTDSIDLVGEFSYRATEEFEVETTLFPANLDIENESANFDLGIRFNF